jgi:hypothetical protein
MERDTMLDILAELGQDAGSDYNDAEDVDGWFGWTISDTGDAPVLTVTYEASTDTGPAPAVARSWRLIEVQP